MYMPADCRHFAAQQQCKADVEETAAAGANVVEVDFVRQEHP